MCRGRRVTGTCAWRAWHGQAPLVSHWVNGKALGQLLLRQGRLPACSLTGAWHTSRCHWDIVDAGVSCCQCRCGSMHNTAVAAQRGGAQTQHPVPGICPAARRGQPSTRRAVKATGQDSPAAVARHASTQVASSHAIQPPPLRCCRSTVGMSDHACMQSDARAGQGPGQMWRQTVAPHTQSHTALAPTAA